MKHCLEGFRGGLTVDTVVEQLVWAHKRGPAEARAIATEFFVAHVRAVRVRACFVACECAARPASTLTVLFSCAWGAEGGAGNDGAAQGAADGCVS